MRKRFHSLTWAMLALLVLAGLMTCAMPNEPAEMPPAEALSHQELLANLDALQGPATRSITEPDRTVFTLPSGTQLSSQDLSTYLNAIKKDLAGYVYTLMASKPYLVVPVRLSWVTPDNRESGLMWVPFTWGISKRFPIISYQHGTQVYQYCAPSRFNPDPFSVLSSPDLTGALQNYVECIVGALMASAGYIVVMPDYVGFGDSTGPDHPYVTMALGKSVRGAVGAAGAKLTGRAVQPNSMTFLTGYSEGGYATMAGARELLQGIPSVPVAGIVPCDGAYDLSGVMLSQMLSGQPVKVPSYLLYSASGYHAVYPEVVKYHELFIYPYDQHADDLFDGEHVNAEVGAAVPPTTIPREMLTSDAINYHLAPGGKVFELLEQNNAWVEWVPAPMTLYFVHCPADDVVPYQNALNARAHFATHGLFTPIIDVPAIPMLATVFGNIHVAAYPTAMLAAFKIIDGLN